MSLCLGLLLGAASLGIFFVPRSADLATPSIASSPSALSRPTIVMKNIAIHEYEKSHKYEFILTAEEGTFDHNSENVACLQTKCQILCQGTSLGLIHAQKSLLDQHKKQILFQGPLHATYKDLDIQGSDIEYNFLRNIVATKKTIVYSHPLFSLSAHESIFDIKAEKIFMQNGVRTEFSGSPAANKCSN